MTDEKKDNIIEKNANDAAKKAIKSDLKAYMRNVKVQMVSSTMIFVVGLIIVMTFATIRFDIEDLQSKLQNLAILLALAIYGMVAGRAEGTEWALKREHGLYRYTMNKYTEVAEQAGKYLQYLDQWCDILFYRKRKEKVLTILGNWGVDDPRVLDLTIDELHELVNRHYRKDWKGGEYGPSRHADKYAEGDNGEPYVSYFDPYTEEQVAVIKACITNKYHIEKIGAEYLMNPDGTRTKDAYFTAPKAQSSKNKMTMTMMLSRLLMFVVISAVLASTTLDIINASGADGGNQVVNAAFNALSRLFTLFSSIVWGFMVGTEVTKIDQYYLSYRIFLLRTYVSEYESKLFVPQDKAEIRKKEYEEEKQRDADALARIIPIKEIGDGTKG